MTSWIYIIFLLFIYYHFRYLSTLMHVKTWYSEDVFDPSTRSVICSTQKRYLSFPKDFPSPILEHRVFSMYILD